MMILDIGNNRTVVPMLKIVCTILISVCVITPFPALGFTTSKSTIAIILKITVPIILNKRCMSAAVFAFFFVPTLESIAVTQVPIFCPIIM